MNSSVGSLIIYYCQDMEACKCPSTDEQIKKIQYIYIQWNTAQPFAQTWMKFEGVMLSEMSDRERKARYDITYMQTHKRFIQHRYEL